MLEMLAKEQPVTRKKNTTKFTWKIENFSKQKSIIICSDTFSVGGHKWRLSLSRRNIRYLCAYLEFNGSATLSSRCGVPTDSSFTLVDQLTGNSICERLTENFKKGKAPKGCEFRVQIRDFARRGFLVNDTVIIEAEVSTDLYATLYIALRMLRNMFRKASGWQMMESQIYGDDIMQEISKRIPRTKEELLKINGIETTQVSNYGDQILHTIEVTIRDWYKKEGSVNNDKDTTSASHSPESQECVSNDSREVNKLELEDQSKGNSSSPSLFNKVAQSGSISCPCSTDVQLASNNTIAEHSTLASSWKPCSTDVQLASKNMIAEHSTLGSWKPCSTDVQLASKNMIAEHSTLASSWKPCSTDVQLASKNMIAVSTLASSWKPCSTDVQLASKNMIAEHSTLAGSWKPSSTNVQLASKNMVAEHSTLAGSWKPSSTNVQLASKNMIAEFSTLASSWKPCSTDVQLASKNMVAELSTLASSWKPASVVIIPESSNDDTRRSALLQQQREKLDELFKMPLEAISQANWFDTVQELAMEISELATDPFEKKLMNDLLPRLVGFKNIVMGSLSIVESTPDLETSSAQTIKELERTLLENKKHLTFLDYEASRIEEKKMKVEAEIQYNPVHENDSTVAEMEAVNTESSIKLRELKRKGIEDEQADESQLRAKERLAQSNTSGRGPNWSIFEDEALCKAWVEILEDTSNGKSLVQFWDRVHQIFSAKGFGLERTNIGLQSRYKKINNQCHLWNASWRSANATAMSSSNLIDVECQAEQNFQANNEGKPFKFEHCWHILGRCSKFIQQVFAPMPPIPLMDTPCSTMPSNENDSPDIQANDTLVSNNPKDRDQQKKKKRRTRNHSTLNVVAWEKGMAELVRNSNMHTRLALAREEREKAREARDKRKHDMEIMMIDLSQFSPRSRSWFEAQKDSILASYKADRNTIQGESNSNDP